MKPSVIQTTDSDVATKPTRPHRTINIEVPNHWVGRVVRHFKGRRYVINYSWFDLLTGFKP